MAAQRTRREPCLVIRAGWTWASAPWCLDVSPNQYVSFDAEANRVVSPISAGRAKNRPTVDTGSDPELTYGIAQAVAMHC